jgi:hypothetical protein
MSNKWATTGRGHDLFPGHGTNGKGDKNRTTDNEAYRKGYDEINWRRKGPCPTADSGAASNPECNCGVGGGVTAISEDSLGTDAAAEKSTQCGLPAVSENKDGDSAICESGFGSPRKTSV